MYKVKIYGAGSIGNHMCQAARRLGWSVDLCDIDAAALERTKTEIYPSRYGAWDEAVNLYHLDSAPSGIYDMIIIGTPPDSHLDLAISAIKEEPKAILIEKPFCCPDMKRAQEYYDLVRRSGIASFVGYDHVVGRAIRDVEKQLASGALGAVETLDVEFREHWGGIFAAHPWLDGAADSYLGHWRRGGGATGEHSHAINLWQHMARLLGAGKVIEVGAMVDYIDDGDVDYDKICAINLRTESGLAGRVVQDVVTSPPRKWGRVQGRFGHVEWVFGHKPDCDAVWWRADDVEMQENLIKKTRPDDFLAELEHLRDVIEGDGVESPISLQRGLDTMLVIAAVHRSAGEKRVVRIDYDEGYGPSALSTD